MADHNMQETCYLRTMNHKSSRLTVEHARGDLHDQVANVEDRKDCCKLAACEIKVCFKATESCGSVKY